jgi:hypothetical protein
MSITTCGVFLLRNQPGSLAPSWRLPCIWIVFSLGIHLSCLTWSYHQHIVMFSVFKGAYLGKSRKEIFSCEKLMFVHKIWSKEKSASFQYVCDFSFQKSEKPQISEDYQWVFLKAIHAFSVWTTSKPLTWRNHYYFVSLYLLNLNSNDEKSCHKQIVQKCILEQYY